MKGSILLGVAIYFEFSPAPYLHGNLQARLVGSGCTLDTRGWADVSKPSFLSHYPLLGVARQTRWRRGRELSKVMRWLNFLVSLARFEITWETNLQARAYPERLN